MWFDLCGSARSVLVMADNTEEIEELEEILNTGATKIVQDGMTVEIDQEAARRRLAELRRQDDAIGDQRPPFLNVYLGGF